MRSGFFNSEISGFDENGLPVFDRAESADFWAEYFSRFIGNGVYINPSSSFQILASSGLTLTVKAGACFINGYFAFDKSDSSVTLSDANPTLPRIDRIVARLDLSLRSISIAVLTGTPSSSPVSPALTRNALCHELALADVTVLPGALSVSQSAIIDLRSDSLLCGFVSGVINQIDTTDLFAQFEASFEEFLGELDELLGDDDAATLAEEIALHAADTGLHLSDEQSELLSGGNLMQKNVAQVMSAPISAYFDGSSYTAQNVRNIAFLPSAPMVLQNGNIAAVYS